MSNQEIRNNLIKTRDKIEYLLNKGCSIEDISEKLGIRIGHFREKGSVNWFKKCIISKKSMKKRHIEHPEIFTKQRLNLDEEKIKNLYLSKEMPPYKIANLMNCDTVTIFNRLRKMNVRIRGYSESHLLKTYTGIKKIRRNGLIPEKAYILGVLCGDAWMKKYGIVLSAIDKDFVQEFQRNIKITYGIDCSIRKYVPKNIKWSLQHVVGLYSKLAYEDIRSYGIFNTAEWRVPKDIINSNDTNIIGNLFINLE